MNILYKLIPKSIKKKINNKLLERVRSQLRNTEVKYKIYKSEINRLDKKVAIITGGSGEIGSAICFKLAMEGAIVYVAGRNIDNINTVIKQIEDNGGIAFPLILDITNYEDITEKFMQVYKKHNRIDILVNNAGGSAREKSNTIVNQDVNVIKNVINTNLTGTILCSKEASKYMIKNNNGKIINIGSTVGVGGYSGFSEYCASKAGVIGFTKSHAMELAKYNICVNCVTPGLTEQTIFDKSLEKVETDKNYIGYYGKTDDIANAVEFFCRDESSFIIGQNLIVDGGRSLGLKGN